MSEPASTLALSDTLCARLCHDLSSPLGTLLGSLELMAEDPGSIAEALPLAGEIAQAMAARLRLLRAAWTSTGGALTPGELAGLAKGLPERVQADFSGLDGPSYAGPAARILLNLLLLGAEALPRGGIVRLAGQPGRDVLMTLDGPAAAWPAGLAAALAGAAAPDDPRTILPALVVMLALEAGLRLSMLMPGGASVSAPPLRLALG